MKKYILTSPNFTFYLIFGSLLLGVLAITLSVYDIIETGDLISQTIGRISGAMLLAAIILRFYQAKVNGTLKPLLIRLGIGVAIVIAMILTKLIDTPPLLKDLF